MQCPSCHSSVEGNPSFCASCGAALPVAPPPDPLLGRTLAGKVRIVQLLGEGGMGAVYVGEQAVGTNVRKVAVKTLHAHLSRDEKIRERFMREAGTLAGLEHPNTVQVFDFGTTDDGVLFMVMEFVQGRSIADELEKTGAMKPDRVEKILTQIAGSLAEAHEKGIIHRDLKPDNIVLTERAGQKDFVKVLDFGIAKRSTAADSNEKKLTQQGMVLGTPPYMSPEQFTGQALDARSDIYSLAVMAYEMLTRQLPFDAKSAFEWATLHMTAAPKPLEAAPDGSLLPESERNAIMKALAKDPAQRFATVTDFVERFSGRAAASASEVARQQPTAPGGRQATAGMAGAPAPVPAPAPAPAPDNLKGKTQIGEPAPFGSSPAFPAGGTAMGAPLAAPMASPAASAVAPPAYGPAPSPAVAPPVVHAHAAPQSDRRSGGNKGLIIGVLAVAALSCIGLIAWGMGAFSGGGSSPTPTVDLGASSGTAPPATTTAPPSTPTDTSSSGGAPPLSNTTTPPLGGGSTSGGVVHPTAPKDAGAKPVPTPVPTPQPNTPPPTPTPHPTTPPPAPTPTPPPPAPTPTPPPAPTPTPPPATPPPGEPAVCGRARDALRRNAPTAAALVDACRQQGGRI